MVTPDVNIVKTMLDLKDTKLNKKMYNNIRKEHYPVANYYSINLDKTGANITFTIFRGPTTLASGGTAVNAALRGNPGDFTAKTDIRESLARILSVLDNDISAVG